MSRNVCTPVTVFQSSPVPKDGRYAINPPVSRQTHVSILARPEGRALPRRARQCDGGGAVSILARPEGRALPPGWHSRTPSDSFQSSPVPKDGRYAYSYVTNRLYSAFQSSPVPKDGRYFVERSVRALDEVFQSSPVPKDGRYHTGAVMTPSGDPVSILARPEGRALRSGDSTIPACPSCFNPRPSRRTGATKERARSQRCRKVSILARPEGRALPP